MRVQEGLFALQDLSFRDFQASLIPNVPKETVIGVRTPQLRSVAKSMVKTGEAGEFLSRLPHQYFEENQLHAFLLSEEKNMDVLLEALEAFLPCVDNWATCDQLLPKAFRRNRERLLPAIDRWLRSEHPYTVRFGIGMLMRHFLDGDFFPEALERVATIRSGEYYVHMMMAWYFATALAKQYHAALPYLTENRLPVWVHNKTLQKAVESWRITPEQKDYLKTLKIDAKSLTV